jgi:23S rRNA pseudouridine2605 synthase
VREVRKSRKIGLARALSKLGYCSRSSAAELIRAGRVSLNGKTCRNPEAATGTSAQIAVDGKVIEASQKVYFMLNKPRGVVTTASDEKGRVTVYGLLNVKSEGDEPHKKFPWVAPVGRLDKASEGLLLLTNDSEWTAHIAAPETHLEKTYHVQISTITDDDFVRDLIHGVKMEDGEVLKAKRASRLRAGEKNCWLEIILDEGKNRQIRRMMEANGVEVLRLIRVAIGPLKLGDLVKGSCRALTAAEKRMLDEAMARTHE